MAEFAISEARIKELKSASLFTGSLLIWSPAISNYAVRCWLGGDILISAVSLGYAAILWIIWAVVSRLIVRSLRASCVQVDGHQVVVCTAWYEDTIDIDKQTAVKLTIDALGQVLTIEVLTPRRRIVLVGYEGMNLLYDEIVRHIQSGQSVSTATVKRVRNPAWMTSGMSWILRAFIGLVFVTTLIRLSCDVLSEIMFLCCVYAALMIACLFASRALPSQFRKRWTILFLVGSLLIFMCVAGSTRDLWLGKGQRAQETSEERIGLLP